MNILSSPDPEFNRLLNSGRNTSKDQPERPVSRKIEIASSIVRVLALAGGILIMALGVTSKSTPAVIYGAITLAVLYILSVMLLGLSKITEAAEKYIRKN